MKLILQNNHIYLPTGNNVVIKDATFNIQVNDDINIADYISSVSINGKQKEFTNYFTINVAELQDPYINLEITLINRYTGDTIKYTADKYPVTRAVVLGLPSNEWYPSTLQSLLERLADLEKKENDRYELISKAIRELNSKGDVL